MSSYAIIGMSCLFPGAHTPADFWTNLIDGVDSRREGGAVFEPVPVGPEIDPEHGIYCTRGGFVTDFSFDPSGYQLDRDYLAGLDRVYQWTLHTAREALRDSGYGDRSDVLARTGLVAGNYSFPTPKSAGVSVPLVQEAVLSGLRRGGVPATGGGQRRPPVLAAEDAWVSGLPARVAATALGLGGPRFALDAACSSALYALELACRHLGSGQADLMLAGGVCAPDPVLIHLCFSGLRAYPRNGFSQPFDVGSAGILTGEGAGMIALRRLADAQRDGDDILAVIEGVGLSNDGSGRHLLMPAASGQRRAYELAYADAGIDPVDIDYLECHAAGTPAGDATEIESVAGFFGEGGRIPLLGSVKGNVGHLLTVAGLSSLLKVVLAIRHGQVPPTIGITEAAASKDGRLSGADLVRTVRSWPASTGPRRAAVSAFGFGGTNAHVVLSQAPAASRPQAGGIPAAPAPRTPLEVIGLGGHFGGLGSVPELEHAFFTGADTFVPLPKRRWRGLEDTTAGTLAAAGLTGDDVPAGGYIDAIEIDPIDYRLPPTDLRNINVQHLLAMRVTDEALHDAGYDRTPVPGGKLPVARRVAVVIAMEIEPSAHMHLARYGIGAFLGAEFDRSAPALTAQQRAGLSDLARDAVHEPILPNEILSYIGNVMASRISSRWNLTGPSFTVSSDDAAAVEALQVAELLLQDPTIEAVLVGAVDLAGSPERLLLRGAEGRPAAGPGLAFGAGTGGWRPGDGAGAVVLVRPADGTTAGRPTGLRSAYARLESVVVRHSPATQGRPPHVDAPMLASAAREALRTAGVSAGDIGYLEACATGVPAVDAAELTALAAAYPAGSGQVALGSAGAQLGEAGCAAVLGRLIRAVLCLHHGYVPGVASWTRPADELAETMAASAFYVPPRSQPWLRTAEAPHRHAAVNVVSSAGAHGHVVLSAAPDGVRRAAVEVDWRAADGPVMLALGAADAAGLRAAVDRNRELLLGGADPYQLAREAALTVSEAHLRVVLAGSDRAGLLRQLDRAAHGLTDGLNGGGDWATPEGSFAAGAPIGPTGKVALVYPGLSPVRTGLGRDLFRAFPALLRHLESEVTDPAAVAWVDRLHPRTQRVAGPRELIEREAALGRDVPFLLATGTTFAAGHTDMLRELLGIGVQGALGYGLGEWSMRFAAAGGWRRDGCDRDHAAIASLLGIRLGGTLRTVRDAWDLPDRLGDHQVWRTRVLFAAAAEVRASVATFPRLYVTLVNTPNEVVVAGDPQELDRLVAELSCASAETPANVALHCEMADREFPALVEANRGAVGTTGGLELFSSADYAAEPDGDSTATRVAQALRREVDFPRLVETAYARGYRYFLEVGPGSACSGWIGDILGDRPHVAIPVDHRGAPTTKALTPLLTRLIAHGVPVGWDALLDPGRGRVAPSGRLTSVGGGPSIPDRVASAAASGHWRLQTV